MVDILNYSMGFIHQLLSGEHHMVPRVVRHGTRGQVTHQTWFISHIAAENIPSFGWVVFNPSSSCGTNGKSQQPAKDYALGLSKIDRAAAFALI